MPLQPVSVSRQPDLSLAAAFVLAVGHRDAHALHLFLNVILICNTVAMLTQTK